MALAMGFGTKGLSRNGKTGAVAATYRAVGTDNANCPHECPLLASRACYALGGAVNWQQRDAQRRSFDVEAWLTALPVSAAVRHLVSGDLFMNDQPDHAYIDGMIAGHAARPDLRGWAYTHGWRRLLPMAVNAPGVCVNASTESVDDAQRALAAGWPVVQVVASDHAALTECETHVTRVCPYQTHGVTCDVCMLCAKPARRMRGKPLVIAFRAHGQRTGAADETVKRASRAAMAAD
jgi:hypothetical protein